MQTIDQLIHSSCQNNQQRTAIQYKYADSWTLITYTELWSEIEKLAAGIRQLGLAARTNIAILASSSPQWVIAYLAILRCGGIVVPIDKELKAAELRHILIDCDARAIFVGPSQYETLREISADLPLLQHIITLSGSRKLTAKENDLDTALTRFSSAWQQLKNESNLPAAQYREVEHAYSQLHRLVLTLTTEGQRKKAAPATPEQHDTHRRTEEIREPQIHAFNEIFHHTPLSPAENLPDQTAAILYTSGTTGRSKGAMLTHHNITSNINAVIRHLNLQESISTLSFLPINHVFEQVCGILLPLSLGGKVTFAESIKKLGDNLKEIKPTFLLAVPAVYRLLYERIIKRVESSQASRIAFKLPLTRTLVTNRIRRSFGQGTIFVSGGAALDPDVAEGFTRLGLNLVQGYGITETSPVIAAETPTVKKPGTVGQVLEGVEIKIDHPNSSGVGEILVKGPNVMSGYYKNPAATKEILHKGWYHTGDLGVVDKNGILTICGRVKNLIVTPNGKNVYPEEVENQLLKSPYIAEIMVYGHKVNQSAEEVYAVIYPDNETLFKRSKEQGLSAMSAMEVEKLIKKELLHYGQDLADYKRVKKFTLREDEFPKTSTRKIKRYIVEPDISTS